MALYKDSLPVKPATNYDYSNMECTDFLVYPPNSVPIHLAVVYRPPKISVLKCGEDIADYMEKKLNW